MRIGFFGGSFDPPHLGHLAVGRAAVQAFKLDKLLIAPTGRQPLKPEGPTASFADRLQMVTLLCAPGPGDAAPKLEPSILDAPRTDGLPNYTVDALSELRAQVLEDDRLFALIGVDAFLGLPSWKSHEELLRLAEWIVVSRPGSSLEQLDKLRLTPEQLQRVHLLAELHEPASATSIRELLKLGSDCTGLLPESILQYIRARHLYGT